MRLNIIGNGFDLYHGLPSNYSNFAKWLIKNDTDLFESIGKYYDVQIYQYEDVGYNHEIVGYYIQDKFWSVFEAELGRLNTMSFEEQLLDDLDLENDDPVSLISDVNADRIAEELKKRFAEWVYYSVDVDKAYRIINKMINGQKLSLFPCDHYIDFNYTHSLQRIYKIPDNNIFYPHGECFSSDSSLIVGHGNNESIANLEQKITHMEETYTYTQAERNRIDEMKCELSFLKKLKKDSVSLSKTMEYYLDDIASDIDSISIYGFSFGDVDLPYIRVLVDRFSNVKWNISYYKKDCSTEEKIKALINRMNNNHPVDISFFEFNNPNSEKIKILLADE